MRPNQTGRLTKTGFDDYRSIVVDKQGQGLRSTATARPGPRAGREADAHSLVEAQRKPGRALRACLKTRAGTWGAGSLVSPGKRNLVGQQQRCAGVTARRAGGLPVAGLPGRSPGRRSAGSARQRSPSSTNSTMTSPAGQAGAPTYPVAEKLRSGGLAYCFLSLGAGGSTVERGGRRNHGPDGRRPRNRQGGRHDAISA